MPRMPLTLARYCTLAERIDTGVDGGRCAC